MSVPPIVEGHMRDDVSVMNYSKDCVDFVFHELRQVTISDSGLSEIVNLNWEFSAILKFNFQSSNKSYGSSETVSSRNQSFDLILSY